MKKSGRGVISLALFLAVCLTALVNVLPSFHGFDNVASVQYADGSALVAQYRAGGIAVERISQAGVVTGSFTVAGKSGGELVSLNDMAADADGNVYLLLEHSDAMTGDVSGQELAVYRTDRLVFKKVASHALDASAGVRWRWLSVTSSASVMGTTADGKSIVRDVYDLTALTSRAQAAARSSRTCAVQSGEGIWRAWAMGSATAYVSGSGKLYLSGEDGTVAEVYPARVLDRVMYPIYASPIDTETMYLGEQESGDLLVIDVTTRETTVVLEGGQALTGSGSYTPADLVAASVADESNFAGFVKNEGENRYELVLRTAGQTQIFASVRPGAASLIGLALLWLVVWTAVCALVLTALRSALERLAAGRTLASKMLSTAVPVLALAVALFGAFSYASYRQSILDSFEKQVVDEGNMLMALFGTESFDAIEYPYDYNSDDYGYLLAQMNTRSVYTRTAYYERGSLFTGVDRDAPCFYPFGINMNADADALYREAAYTGTAQTGVLRDKNGERLVCVTPVGGAAGGTVYLLETGILMENIDTYTRAYLITFCAAGAAFLLAVSLILTLVFRRALRPLSDIRKGLELFAQGDRTVRLEDSDTAELSGIARVFNQMAGDIDVQLYNLRQTSGTYFRFIPQKVFRLLGKDNLGDLDLASGKQASYHILSVELSVPARASNDEAKNLTDRFFSIVDGLCDEHDAVLLTDSVNLRRLQVICPKGGDSAVDIALSALSRLDAANASMPVQSRMDAFFLVHRADVYYGICGDEKRLVPAMISGELDYLTGQACELRRYASRLVVTRAGLDGVDEGNYFHRYIGCPEGADDARFGLYDFYDSSTPEEIRLINETKSTFDKAMELYTAGRWYDAKNMFAVVLRENQYDNVSRAYIFRCESHL